MTTFIILTLIVLGLFLIVAEFFIIPGTTIFGFIGGVVVILGIVGAFLYLEHTTAWIILGSTLAVSILIGVVGLRSSTWQRFAVKSTIDSKIVDPVHSLEPNTKGVTITPCNPIGKAKFADEVEEVYSITDFIEVNTPIKILYIKENKIFVDVIKS